MEAISFSFVTHAEAGTADWYRCEQVGRTGAGEGTAGWGFLCGELDPELASLSHGFEKYTFDSQDWWNPATRQVTTRHKLGSVSLARRTLYTVRRGEWGDNVLSALHGLGTPTRPGSVASPPVPTERARAATVAEVLQCLATRRCLVFTGAGISRAAGVPDFATFDFSAAFGLGGPHPLNEFVRAIVERPEVLLEACRRAFVAKPTPAHEALKQLHDLCPFRLVSGNIDGLHEATGLEPTRQASDTTVQFSGLADCDTLVAVGISHDGMGPVAREFRRLHPDGVIVAIDLATPSYLEPGDRLLQGDLQELLPEIARLAAARQRIKP
ncbi:MAG TPA: Sir2 family NAD-dependent protein deacetylase [Anaerolineae bacterium]|nr:Sir2 family NAD-dependent protein deacetylase [Anaerolineae bacterium]